VSELLLKRHGNIDVYVLRFNLIFNKDEHRIKGEYFLGSSKSHRPPTGRNKN
jgi:hypothetical protein